MYKPERLFLFKTTLILKFLTFFIRKYKVLPTEPLLDMKEHISNVVTEIVGHLTDDEKKICKRTIELVSGTKEQLRGPDYREMAIVLAKQLRG